MTTNDKLTPADLISNPTNPWLLDDDGLDPDGDVEVWWARELTPAAWDQIAGNGL
jgi:hypothetical protein